jgi:hypothetical protein
MREIGYTYFKIVDQKPYRPGSGAFGENAIGLFTGHRWLTFEEMQLLKNNQAYKQFLQPHKTWIDTHCKLSPPV